MALGGKFRRHGKYLVIDDRVINGHITGVETV